MLQDQINGLLRDPQYSDIVKRNYLERVLRYVALDQKDKFSELKSSVLVRTWERETGQVW